MTRFLCYLGLHHGEHRTSGYVETYKCDRCPYMRIWWAPWK